MIVPLALVAALAPEPAPASDPRTVDPSVPTSVPAPEGEDVPVDGAAIVGDDEPEPRTVSVPPPRPKAAPAEDPEDRPREWAVVDRRGTVLLATVGAGGCTQDQCESLKAVPWFGITGGYRFGRFAPIVTIQGGAGPAKAPTAIAAEEGPVPVEDARDTRTFLNIGAGTLLHLLQKSRFDPYFGLTLGYLRSSVRSTGVAATMLGNAKYDFTEVVHRGTLGIVIGLGMRLGQRVTIGPRVDVLVPFRGKSCVTQLDGEAVCTKLDDLQNTDPGQYYPRPWSATLQIGVVL